MLLIRHILKYIKEQYNEWLMIASISFLVIFIFYHAYCKCSIADIGLEQKSLNEKILIVSFITAMGSSSRLSFWVVRDTTTPQAGLYLDVAWYLDQYPVVWRQYEYQLSFPYSAVSVEV